jgi:Tfp pilus assembly protein PilF
MRAASHPVVAAIVALASASLLGCNSMSGHMNNQVGMMHYQQGNYLAARTAFYRAAADNPQNASFTYNLATAMRRQGDITGAETAYVKAIHIDPSHQPAYHGLAQLMIEQGRTAEATEMITSWANVQPRHPGAQIELAMIQKQNGDIAGSEQSLYRALAIRPNNPIATAQLGQLYQDTGQLDRASLMYQRSLRSDWMQPQVQSRLASLRGTGAFGGYAGGNFGPAPTMMAAAPYGYPYSGPPWASLPSPPAAGLPPAPHPDRPFRRAPAPTPAESEAMDARNADPAHVPR